MKKNTPNTELLYKKSKPIDQLDLLDGIQLMINEQKKASYAVKKSIKEINYSINQIYQHLVKYKKGRIIYVGAGTSGRIGVQDGVELFPTFNWPKNRLEFIIGFKDVVIGLAASGNTPFTCKVLEKSLSKNALTIAISNNPNGDILNFGKINIVLDTKEEVIAGSTRLKAGTAQKICLNIISSMVMLKMGKVKNGLMNDMVPTNQKLRKRKKIINTSLDVDICDKFNDSI